tara:strand:- start:12526 stop:13278 length:753 start_codon:yes stop_codon:yes gene_type:complete
MIILDKNESTLEELKHRILGFRKEDSPLILRKACDENFTEKSWFDYLEKECSLTPDMRHISFEGELTQKKWWEISNQIDKSSAYAHSTTAQPFHSDNAWFARGPEVNFFIMKKQAVSGGENLFYPINRLLNDLEKEDEGLLQDLLHTEVTISKGNENVSHRTPIIVTEGTGKIFWNYYRTDKSEKFVKDMCDRFFSYLSNKEESSSVMEFRCESDDAFLFNDQKILHARKSFNAFKERDRVLLQSMWYLP